MWKMVLAIVVLAGSLAGARFVKLGELTFAEHLSRILQTPEAQELGDGIVATVSSAKTKVKSKIRAKLAATKKPPEEEPEVDVEAALDEEEEIEAQQAAADGEDEVEADEEPSAERVERPGRRRSLF